MIERIPDLLTGTELCLVAEVPGAGNRWGQLHLNKDIARQFFNLEPGADRSIMTEWLSADGHVLERKTRGLVFSQSNRNPRIEFRGPRVEYPPLPDRPLVAVVEAEYLTYRYRMLMPGEDGYDSVLRVLAAGPSIGRGLRRRIVTLDELEAYWPQSRLRGGV
jgi:hypothetical protein